ncbi:MAG TPA: hypothetical protein VFF19_11225 [Reyranella sp.]|nr:hypothetical protein [Reyranella sp.]
MLNADQHAIIAAAIQRAEATTSGEIRVVVTTRPLIRHPFYAVMWAALLALALPWPLALLTTLSIPELLAIQAVTFIVAGAALMFTPLGPRVVPRAALNTAARAAAIDHFLAQGMHQTRARTGVLIMVALHEHLVEVVADEGIHAQVGHDAWQAVCETVLIAARDGRLTDGLVEGVAHAGRILAAHVPRQPGDTNELPDRVVII